MKRTIIYDDYNSRIVRGGNRDHNGRGWQPCAKTLIQDNRDKKQ